jgi:hypothetical protein
VLYTGTTPADDINGFSVPLVTPNHRLLIIGNPAASISNESIGADEVKPAKTFDEAKFCRSGVLGIKNVVLFENRTVTPIGGQKLPRSSPTEVTPGGKVTVIPWPGMPHGTCGGGHPRSPSGAPNIKFEEAVRTNRYGTEDPYRPAMNVTPPTDSPAGYDWSGY